MKLLANSSYRYQGIDRSRCTVTNYIKDVKTHAVIISKPFEELFHVNNALYQVELAKAELEHKKPIIVGFFICQYAKLRMLVLYYNFSTNFCDVSKFEELKRETDSLYLALTERELGDCIRPGMKAEWERLRSKECTDSFTADAVAIFPQKCCDNQKKTWQETTWTLQRGVQMHTYALFMYQNLLLL